MVSTRKEEKSLADADLWPQVVLIFPPCGLPSYSGHTLFCDRKEVNIQRLKMGPLEDAQQTFLLLSGKVGTIKMTHPLLPSV